MIKLAEHKHKTQDRDIEILPEPKRVYIPLSQHTGTTCSPIVKIGDAVFTGQMIATTEAHVFAPIHASISGKIVSILDWPHPLLGRCKAVVIERDGLDNPWLQEPRHSLDMINNLDAERLHKFIFEAGIVGMGGASFPTHIKLKPPTAVDTLIINGAECEPYLTADYRLMIEKTAELLKGIELIVCCLGVDQVYIAIEDNKPEAIKKFQMQNKKFKIAVLKSRYPQGSEKQLIKNILAKEVGQGRLPFDIGVVVQNVSTVFAIYEAVYKNKPLYERVVTVTGSCLSYPKNILVRMGTPIKELIDFCGPLVAEPVKIIMGGPMMGIAQYTDTVPVIKSTTGVVLLSKKEVSVKAEEPCIRCGACIRECPVSLMPSLINLASRKELWSQARLFGALDCIECGLCSYVCPSNIMLVQAIKQAKLELTS